MRISLEIDATQIRELDRLAKSRGTNRAALIQQALAQYVARQATDAFGSWRDVVIDGVDYQQKLRDEW